MAVYPLESFGAAVYEKIEPATHDDEASNFALAHYVAAISRMFQEVDSLVAEVNGRPPWGALFDIATLPAKGLGWLGQFVGVSPQSGLSDADQRTRILSTAGFWRGTPASLRAAAQAYLTGGKTVIFRERDAAACPTQPAYGLTVITYTAETPDAAKVLAALLAQKPAGIVLNYQVHDGQDYQSLLTNHPLYSNVFADYATYQGIVNDVPGT